MIQTQIIKHLSVITAIRMSNFNENNNTIILNESVTYYFFNSISKDNCWYFLYDKSNINLINNLFFEILLNAIEKATCIRMINSKNKKIED